MCCKSSLRFLFPVIQRNPFIKWGPEWGYGIVRALNPATGEKFWDHTMRDLSDVGILTTATASALLFSGNREGYFSALDAKTGKELKLCFLNVSKPVYTNSLTFHERGFYATVPGPSLFNRVRFSAGSFNLDNANFGVVTSQANDPRRMQLGLKLYW